MTMMPSPVNRVTLLGAPPAMIHYRYEVLTSRGCGWQLVLATNNLEAAQRSCAARLRAEPRVSTRVVDNRL